MTNAMIIFNEAQKLAEEGKIKYTGKTFKSYDGAGNEIELKETEPIHTYQIWKQLGYQVMKGQKAVTQIVIWKHTAKINEDGEEENARMFMKKASFFSFSQVEKIA